MLSVYAYVAMMLLSVVIQRGLMPSARAQVPPPRSVEGPIERKKAIKDLESEIITYLESGVIRTSDSEMRKLHDPVASAIEELGKMRAKESAATLAWCISYPMSGNYHPAVDSLVMLGESGYEAVIQRLIRGPYPFPNEDLFFSRQVIQKLGKIDEAERRLQREIDKGELSVGTICFLQGFIARLQSARAEIAPPASLGAPIERKKVISDLQSVIITYWETGHIKNFDSEIKKLHDPVASAIEELGKMRAKESAATLAWCIGYPTVPITRNGFTAAAYRGECPHPAVDSLVMLGESGYEAVIQRLIRGPYPFWTEELFECRQVIQKLGKIDEAEQRLQREIDKGDLPGGTINLLQGFKARL